MRYFTEKDGTPAPFKTAADRKALIGKDIIYLRGIDIDKSGRGYFFPRWGYVEDCVGRELILDSATVMASDLVEVVIRNAQQQEEG